MYSATQRQMPVFGHIPPRVQRDIERVARFTMTVILLTAGTSKFFSDGDFFAYYSSLFQGELRIRLPVWLVNAYLHAIPFIEIALGLSLVSARLKPYSVYAWYGFFISLLIGHYVLQEWSSVNQILDYIFLGLICQLLPARPIVTQPIGRLQ